MRAALVSGPSASTAWTGGGKPVKHKARVLLDPDRRERRPAVEPPPRLTLRAGRKVAVLGAAGLGLVACQALPPVLTSALVGFGQDVLAAAAHNFTPQYSQSMQQLFFAMAETATGAPFSQQAYAGQDGYGGGGYPPDPFGQDLYDQEPYSQDPNGQLASSQDPYAQQSSAQQDPYAAPSHGQPAYGQDAYAQSGYAQPPPVGIALEVALLAQQRTPDGAIRLRPVQDGDTLYDGRGDPARGDKIKVFFQANCACFVYVIGVDATGFVAQVFPEGDIRSARRVTPGARHLLPEGTGWWGLDDHRGVEHIYFIASRERRRDIEDLIADLAGQRPAVPADYRPVREPAVVAMTRGLVLVQSAAPTTVPTEYGAAQEISPTLFQATVADADLVITRWFRHE